MKENSLYITHKNARFRRWSRASWAVFASLSLVVTIGCLSISVGEKSLLKSKAELSDTTLSTIENDSDRESETEVLDNLSTLLTEIVILNQTSEAATACGLNNIVLSAKPLEEKISFNGFFNFLRL
ncbi:MAG: hypothetical protein JXR27_09035 [Paludibacteraceae bacterium]|nr:hypothetical protein [Paludibacteraceae bacterium]